MKIYWTVNKPSDTAIFQDDINAVDKLSKGWQLHFNASKIHALQFGRNRIINTQLGAMSPELGFHKHTVPPRKRTNEPLSQIKRTIKYKGKEIIKPLYTVLERTLPEYVSVIWNPRYKEDQNDIEKVQLRATKLVESISYLEYWEKLKNLHLRQPSLFHVPNGFAYGHETSARCRASRSVKQSTGNRHNDTDDGLEA